MPAPVPKSGQNPELKPIAHVYGAFVAALLLSFIPDPLFAVVSVLFFAGVLVAAYIIRRKSETDSLTENHMTWVIRTIWIVCLFSFITTAAGGIYLWTQLDYSAMEPCSANMGEYILSQGENISNKQLLALAEPCKDEFFAANMRAFIIAATIAALPLVLYLVLRITKGLSRAIKGYRIANPEEWF
jgi:uncharacterized membrane protein